MGGRESPRPPAIEGTAMHTITPDRVLALPPALWRGYRRSLDRRAASAALRRLDDHILRDIGLRTDIDRTVRGGIW
jgi:uncharacterized protein YjiS (DUF1127 family)